MENTDWVVVGVPLILLKCLMLDVKLLESLYLYFYLEKILIAPLPAPFFFFYAQFGLEIPYNVKHLCPPLQNGVNLPILTKIVRLGRALRFVG